MVVLLGLLMVVTGSVAAQSADSVVASDGTGDYTSIQDAVDDATEGDRIKVEAGSYEQNARVDKTITLYAPNGANITNTSTSTSGFQISGDSNPTISGFNLIGWRLAISAGASQGSWTVKDTKITGGSCGVCAVGTPGNWTVKNTVIENAGTISGYGSSGNWTITNSTIEGTDILAMRSTANPIIKNSSLHDISGLAIEAENTSGTITVSNTNINEAERGVGFDQGSTGDLIVENTTFEKITDEAVDAENSSGTITVSNTNINGVEDAVNAETSSGNIILRDTNIQTARNGINAEKSESRITIKNLTVNDTEGDGIDASNATGNATVRKSSFTNMGDKSIDVIDSEGSWQIHESILTGGSEGTLDAWGAKRMINASRNYWGAASGPSETFCGSGGAIGGYNVTMYPYYTDSSLTTLPSATTSGTVEITDSCLIPEDIDSSGEQTLTLTVAQMSADGETDEISITMPEDVSVDDVNNPQAVGTPYEVNVTNDGDPVTLEVDPDEPTETVDFVIRVPMELSSSSG